MTAVKNKVVVKLPNVASGEKVNVLYLGQFENGRTHELADEVVENFIALSGREWPKDGTLHVPEQPKKEGDS